MDNQKNPQIMTHVHKSVNYTLFDAKFVPRSARFVCLGSYPKGTGAIQVYEITHKELQGDVKLLTDVRTVFGTVFPAGIYLLKVNNRNSRTRCEICSRLTIKIPYLYF